MSRPLSTSETRELDKLIGRASVGAILEAIAEICGNTAAILQREADTPAGMPAAAEAEILKWKDAAFEVERAACAISV